MKEKIYLLLYFFALFFLSYSSNLIHLSVATLLTLAASAVIARKVIVKSLMSFLAFSLLLSVFFLLLYRDFEYVTLINLRILCMSLLTFLFLEKVNLFRALNFSRDLTFLLVLSSSHVLLYRKIFKEFLDAFKSRSMVKPAFKDTVRLYTVVVGYFFDKSRNSLEEVYQAMKSRGYLHD